MQKEPRKADRMEQEPAEFYERVRRGYQDLAAREPNRIVLIDGSPNADEIENEIWNVLSSRFPALRANPQSAKAASPVPDRNSQF
jgi:thymidylate kinase